MNYRFLIKEIISFAYTNLNRNNLNNGGMLCYHNIEIDDSGLFETISPELFEEHLTLISKNFTVISFSEYIHILNSNDPNKIKNKVVITFDDGYLDNYTNARLILKKYKLPAIFFINSNFIKNKIKFSDNIKFRGMSEDQIKDLADDDLFEIGGHTKNHTICSKIKNDKDFRSEITDDKLELERIINKQVNYFAYPNGQGRDISEFVLNKLKDIGYKAACSTFYSNMNSIDDIYHINRIMVWPEMNIKMLSNALNGGYNFHYYIHSIKSKIDYIIHKKKTLIKH